MSKSKPTPNELLYSHVTRVGFDLTLGRTHIAALVYAERSIEFNRRWDMRGQKPGFGRTFSMFATGMGGLMQRGLVVHHFDPKASVMKGGLKPHYTITPAGYLVIGLLKESGLYDEYAKVLPLTEKQSA